MLLKPSFLNNALIALVLVITVIITFYLIRGNRKDEKQFVEEVYEKDIKPEKHYENAPDV